MVGPIPRMGRNISTVSSPNMPLNRYLSLLKPMESLYTLVRRRISCRQCVRIDWSRAQDWRQH
ncbi:hypothetical protein BDD12DRAFT_824146, partial [Trichophaea hybrida]